MCGTNQYAGIACNFRLFTPVLPRYRELTGLAVSIDLWVEERHDGAFDTKCSARFLVSNNQSDPVVIVMVKTLSFRSKGRGGGRPSKPELVKA